MDDEPSNSGQWGIALRYYAEELNDTEFGFYFANVHSRLPLVTGDVATLAQMQQSLAVAGALTGQLQPLASALAIDHYAKQPRYLIEYPEDLQTFGLSFNTALGTTGWALQGEYSYHPDAPLQREEGSLFEEALSPLICSLRRIGQGQSAPDAIGACQQSYPGILGNRLKGYVERDVSQVQVTGIRIFGSMMGSDSTGFIAEAAVSHVHDMPDKNETPLQSGGREIADGTSGLPGSSLARLQQRYRCRHAHPLSSFPARRVRQQSGSCGPFVDGRTVVSLGASVKYLARWEADVSYTRHAGSANKLGDRDFIKMSFSYSF